MIRKVLCIVCLLFSLVGCDSEVLYSDLSEQEVNEMVALLYNAGMKANKRFLGDNKFSLTVPQEEFARAVEMLRANGYPKKKFKSLGEVFQREGFVSSPLEERARLNYAQSQELTKTIESIDGVIMARVHLALPKKDPLSDAITPSSASVFIKYRPGADLSEREAQIKALVVNSVEGLPYDNITVALFAAEPPKTYGRVESRPQYPVSEILMELTMVTAVAILVISGLWFGLRRLKVV
jgi:type III secretion protein J